MEDLIGHTLDGYKILEIIGRGGMGVVFKALDTNLDKIVALKMIDPVLAQDETFIRRFKTEARALARLDNPNIVGVYALRQTEKYFFMVMEFVEARPLSHHIRENGKLKLEDVLKISRQLLQAIGFAHNASILHRDIKPSNILLCKDGKAKITDFGLAKVIKEHDSGATVTQARAGTLYYMSPEQVKGLKNVDKRGDLYSLGMTIYEMIVGRVPFEKTDSDFTIQRKIVDGEIPSPVTFYKDVPKKFTKIILKSIARDPDKRYQSAEEMLADLWKFETDMLEDEKTLIITTKKEEIKRKPLFKKPIILIAGFVLLICLALAYKLIIHPDNDVQKAFISLSVDPPDARITIDDKVIESSQLNKIKFEKAGEVRLLVTKEGFEPIDTLIKTESGKTVSFTFTLNPVFKPVTTGKLSVTTKPPGATVYIDNDSIGNSPFKNLQVTAGMVSLNIEKTGYGSIDTTINIAEEKENSISFNLNKITETGSLNITSNPSGADVWLDRKKLGITPFQKSELPVGKHRLLLRLNGYADYLMNSVQVSANQLTDIPTINLSPAGSITVLSETADAEIYIDNRLAGNNKYINDKIEPGEHNISVRKSGFTPYNKTITIEPNKPQKISARLIPMAGKIEIIVVPYGNIYVDDQLKVKDAMSLYSFEIPGGSHNLKVVNKSLDNEWIKKVEIKDTTVRRYLINFNRVVKLTIISQPRFAEIFIDGKTIEKTTPSEYFIKPGKHIIQVKKDGYLPSEEKEFNVDYDIYESKQDREENLTFLLSKKE